MWPLCIVDTYDLQYRAPDVWAAFMWGDFSCQLSDFPATAIGRDSAGEQERAVYLFDKFVKERIQPESQKSVFDPIKRSKHLLHLISH